MALRLVWIPADLYRSDRPDEDVGGGHKVPSTPTEPLAAIAAALAGLDAGPRLNRCSSALQWQTNALLQRRGATVLSSLPRLRGCAVHRSHEPPLPFIASLGPNRCHWSNAAIALALPSESGMPARCSWILMRRPWRRAGDAVAARLAAISDSPDTEDSAASCPGRVLALFLPQPRARAAFRRLPTTAFPRCRLALASGGAYLARI